MNRVLLRVLALRSFSICTALLLLMTGPAMARAADFVTPQELKEDLQRQASRAWDTAGRELLLKKLGELSKPKSEGLYIIGLAVPHEIGSAAKFAAFLHQNYGLDLVLIAKWRGLKVPAFDGIIVDKDRQVVANFSLKNFVESYADFQLEATSKAFVTMDSFGDFTPWAEMLEWSIISVRERHLDIELGTRGRILLDHPTKFERLERYGRLFEELVTLFGVGEPRMNWLLIDASKFSVDEWNVNLAKYSTTPGPNRTILLLDNKSLYTMHDGKLSVVQIASSSCAQDLKSSAASHSPRRKSRLFPLRRKPDRPQS